MENNLIEVVVRGATQTGKSAILAEIHKHLQRLNVGVIYTDRAHRNNPPVSFDEAESHEKPDLDRTIVVLSEENHARQEGA